MDNQPPGETPPPSAVLDTETRREVDVADGDLVDQVKDLLALQAAVFFRRLYERSLS
jgi:hypothetical protein